MNVHKIKLAKLLSMMIIIMVFVYENAFKIKVFYKLIFYIIKLVYIKKKIHLRIVLLKLQTM